jgi:hypothetical protein
MFQMGENSHWFDLYNKIKKAGKAIQVVHVLPDEVIPLLDAIGPEGTNIHVNFKHISQD